MNDAGTTADARQATESPTGTREKRGAREADAESDGGGKETIGSSNRDSNVGQRERDAESDTGKPTVSPSSRDSNVGQRTADESEPGGKQTIASSEKEASLGQRPTLDAGANDDLGELK
jgi:hypothetical protein